MQIQMQHPLHRARAGVGALHLPLNHDLLVEVHLPLNRQLAALDEGRRAVWHHLHQIIGELVHTIELMQGKRDVDECLDFGSLGGT